MEILNYKLLDDLFGTELFLEVTNIDVRRLRDDRSEIQLGQDVAFVATASFRAAGSAIGKIQNRLDSNLAIGDELLVIGPDAELRSDKVQIDEDSVALWLKDHYDFGFLLNGRPSDAFRSMGPLRVATTTTQANPHAKQEMSLPWITRLNTAVVKDDFIDVDVQIKPLEIVPPPAKIEPLFLATSLHEVVSPGTKPIGRLGATLEVLVPLESIDQVAGHTYVVDVPLTGGARFALRLFHCPSTQEPPKGDGGGGGTKGDGSSSSTKSKH